jgi:hypothetical protein
MFIDTGLTGLLPNGPVNGATLLCRDRLFSNLDACPLFLAIIRSERIAPIGRTRVPAEEG